MRFFRAFFWVCCVYHLFAAAFFIFVPWNVAAWLGYLDLTKNFSPVFLIQSFGLFLVIGGLACAYVAEEPANSVPLVALLTLFKFCLPILAFLALRRGELGMTVVWFHIVNDVIWLPFLAAYYFWFFHKPRPGRFLRFLELFTTDF
jgi:hypothetical protein